MTEEEYERDRAHVRHSDAKAFEAHGAGWIRAKWDGQIDKKQTPALAFGTAFHMAILEPERFANEYAILGDMDFRTKAGKAAKQEAEERGQKSLRGEEARAVLGMQIAALERPNVRALLEKADRKEAALRWKDRAFGSGLPLKSRVDAASSEHRVVIDVKSCGDPTPKAFAAQVARYGYHHQLAWYASGEADRLGCKLEDVACVLLAFEKAEPFRVGVYDMSAAGWIELGADWCRSTLDAMAFAI